MANSDRALAIDLDGTLLVGEDLSHRNRDAVKAASDAGFHIIIATARWRQIAERIASEIGLPESLFIACSGAQVYCRERQADLFDTRLPGEFTEALFDICNNNRCIASTTLDSHSLLKIEPEPHADYLTEEVEWVTTLPPVSQLPRIATVQGSSTVELVRQLHEDWKDAVNIYDSVGPTGRIVITITSSEADKGVALDKACEEIGISPSGVIAFGDSDNDIMMFRAAGESVAMGQASDEIKAAATHVTTDCSDDGVAQFIESNLL